MSTVVSQQQQQQEQQHLLLKKQHVDFRHAERRDIVQTKLNWEISWQIFPTIVWSIWISITLRLL